MPQKFTKLHGALAVMTLCCVTLGALTVALAGEIKRPPSVAEGNYVGVSACKKCHFDSFRSWKGTKHADSFDVLPDKYKSEAECLNCHTTGHDQPGGFTSNDDTPKLAGVQCEMCHGPGEAHVNYAKENEEKKEDEAVIAELHKLIGKGTAESACWKCHLNQTHGKHPEYEK